MQLFLIFYETIIIIIYNMCEFQINHVHPGIEIRMLEGAGRAVAARESGWGEAKVGT